MAKIVLFREDKMSFSRNACIFKFQYFAPLLSPHPHNFWKLNFNSKTFYNANQCVLRYQEGTKINTEVNERALKNIGMHWHR